MSEDDTVLVMGNKRLRQIHLDRYHANLAGPDENGCILWTASVDKAGYGQLRVDNHTLKTHRIAWWLAYGPIPDGLEPDHTCEVERCCNAEHLEAVTHAENMRRYGARMTHCRSGKHRWDEQTPYVDAKGKRECRLCRKDRKPKSDGVHWCLKRDACKNGHPWTPENTTARTGGEKGRRCLQCQREIQQRRNARRRALRKGATI